MRIMFDSRWIAPHGIGRVAREYRDRLARDFELVELAEGPKPSHPLDWLYLGLAFRRSRADFLVSPGYNGTPLAGERQLFIVHDLIHFRPEEPGGRAKRLYYNLITRQAARRGALVTVSHASADEIGRIWPEAAGRIPVVPNGIAQAFLDQSSSADVPRGGLVLFGNARWHKNLERSLDAVARWQQRTGRGSTSVTIVGPGDQAVDIARRLGVTELRLAGKIDDEALAGLLARSEALLFCSLAEGFGLPLCEAVACGCPVVASDLSVMREVGGPGCTFVDPLDVDDIARGIEAAVGQRIGGDTRRSVAAMHDWDRSYDMLARLIRERAPG